MAVFADQLDLRTAVIEAIGDPGISDVFPRLLSMAENNINRQIRHRKQITSASLTFTAGVAPLPADFLEVLRLYDSYDQEMYQAPLSTVKLPFSSHRYFAINDDSALVYGFEGDKTLEYYASIPTITADFTDTNWLLVSYPDVYLYATAFEAAKQVKNAELAAVHERLMKQAFEDMKIDGDRAQFARAVVRVQGLTP